MEVYDPVSTYRLQFNADFSLKDAEKILPYLQKLGIRTIYASPLFQAVRGSRHGYDVTDPLRLNDEIGTDHMFQNLIRKVHDLGMGWIQDMVPNHMAYSVENPWIRDLLVHGMDSEYYHVFDIVSDHPDKELRNRLLLPFFGKSPEELIPDGELTLHFGAQGFYLAYFDNKYPVSARAYSYILSVVPTGEDPAVVTALSDLKKTGPGDRTSPHSATRWQEYVHKMHTGYSEDPELTGHIDRCIETFNHDPERMRELVDRLTYLPVHWKETEQRINYRRFFTINGLICINNHLKEVFDLYHGLMKTWSDRGWVDGLRIDHVDGLYDPSGYLTELRKMTGEKKYIAVEKILEKDEQLPPWWPVQGTTGYDFLSLVNNLLTQSENGEFLYRYYREWCKSSGDPEKIFMEKKRWILYHRLRGDLELLTHESLSTGVFSADRVHKDQIRKAIAEFMVHCPVYRIYRVPSGFSEEEREAVIKIIERATGHDPEISSALNLLQRMFLLKEAENDVQIIRIDRFFRRLMQFTGPLMAKGLEDTAFYTFNPFIAHNEVGDSPGYFGINAAMFHRQMILRQDRSPMTMNCLSSHDTKRGEDVRARLNVISNLPGPWKKVTGSWRKMNRKFKKIKGDKEFPGPADEYMIYQAICGHMPMNGRPDDSFADRLAESLVKSLREGKERSSWSEPDQEYEQVTLEFVNRILDPGHGFLKSVQEFLSIIIPHGIINSITQVILRNTVPGVPDIYQGSEDWNLSFVDPDNRRPVNYDKLSNQLDDLISASEKDPVSQLQELWNHQVDGRLKQWISHLTLQLRAEHPDLFLRGSYIPLRVKGKCKEHLMAFCRSCRDEHLVVAVPLNTAAMPADHRWEDTRIRLPELAPLKWENLLTGEIVSRNGKLPVKQLFQQVPFALLRGIPNQPAKRAGILMHITSLPGDYGAGDFGPGAYGFVDFLQRAGQRYWQILPLSAISPRAGHSPYSSRSAFAGNILMIDPHDLVKKGLLFKTDPGRYLRDETPRADYPLAEKAKNHLLEKAFRAFRKSGPSKLRDSYEIFLEEEAYWLNDYALFETLKQKYPGKTWIDWPEQYRDRDQTALERIRVKHRDAVDRILFAQFIFIEQWKQLKAYANERGVDIFGDLPIYINHDSADVWAHPHLFRLNPDGSMEAVAGVPPDYFNENGQLWGMPLYDWQAMEADGFSWWLRRIGKNLQWFDLLRLDHFRGFSAYWEVPADARVALKGHWIQGPGTRLFDAIKNRFPGLPLVAEDLGQIDQAVYDLRDHYELPGMKVIQFGFGPQMPFSHHYPGNIPYNCIVYTGTHDNNTMKGWFRKEAGKGDLKRIRAFTGNKVTGKNIHREMIRLSYASPARLAIVPMQDWLGLDEKARMNFPSTTRGNWLWRAEKKDLTDKLSKQIKKKVRTFGRF